MKYTLKDKEVELKQFTYVSEWAKELLEKVPEDIEIDTNKKFKFVTLKELGFTDGVSTKEFLNNEFLAKHGLALCNPEDVFEIAKEVKGYTVVGMKPILCRNANPSVFYLPSDDAELRLSAFSVLSDDRWFPGIQFVFLASTSPSEPNLLSSEPLNLELAHAIGVCVMHGYTITKN